MSVFKPSYLNSLQMPTSRLNPHPALRHQSCLKHARSKHPVDGSETDQLPQVPRFTICLAQEWRHCHPRSLSVWPGVLQRKTRPVRGSPASELQQDRRIHGFPTSYGWCTMRQDVSLLPGRDSLPVGLEAPPGLLPSLRGPQVAFRGAESLSRLRHRKVFCLFACLLACSLPPGGIWSSSGTFWARDQIWAHTTCPLSHWAGLGIKPASWACGEVIHPTAIVGTPQKGLTNAFLQRHLWKLYALLVTLKG